MSLPYVSTIGTVTDVLGATVTVGIDHDSVTVCGHPLDANANEEFARLHNFATWQAGANAERMEQEAAWSGPASPQTPIPAEEVTMSEPEHDAAEEEAQADAEPEGDDDADDADDKDE